MLRADGVPHNVVARHQPVVSVGVVLLHLANIGNEVRSADGKRHLRTSPGRKPLVCSFQLCGLFGGVGDNALVMRAGAVPHTACRRPLPAEFSGATGGVGLKHLGDIDAEFCVVDRNTHNLTVRGRGLILAFQLPRHRAAVLRPSASPRVLRAPRGSLSRHCCFLDPLRESLCAFTRTHVAE